MRRVSFAAMLALAAGCADLLGADFDRPAPSTDASASGGEGEGEEQGRDGGGAMGDVDGARGDGSSSEVGCEKDFSACASGCCPRVTQVAAGYDHTCARRADGTVWCWGGNLKGQLGDGTTVDRAVPTKVDLSNVRAVAVSSTSAFSCALAGGDVYCWGDNTVGQLGDGTGLGRLVPTKVTTLASGVESIAVGGQHVCATFGGNAACWGTNYFGQLGVESGSCRSGSSSSSARKPCDARAPIAIAGLAGIVQLGTGSSTTGVLMTADGGVEFKTWGAWADASCRVPEGSPYPCYAMMPKSLAGEPVVSAFALGGGHGCFLSAVPGGVRCWGDDDFGQLGGNTAAADGIVPVLGMSDAESIAAGYRHTCARRAGGSLVCWGANQAAQLGIGSASPKSPPTPVTGLSDVSHVAAGNSHTCALGADGSVHCWGSNSRGQLGAPAASQCGTVPCAMTPVVVSGL